MRLFDLIRLAVLFLCALVGSGCGGDFTTGPVVVDCRAAGQEWGPAKPCTEKDFWGAAPALDDLFVVVGTGNANRGWNSGIHMERIRPAFGMANVATERTHPVIAGGRAVWESVPGFEERTLYRFAVSVVGVNASGPNAWEYTLTGQEKTAPDAAAVVIMQGRTERDGANVLGTLALDWDAAGTLPKALTNSQEQLRGTVAVDFSRTDAEHTISMKLETAETASISTVDYSQRYGFGGEMRTLSARGATSFTGAAYWTTGRARWDASGAGRVDGASSSPMHSSECWDSTLTQVFRFYDGPSGVEHNPRATHTSGNPAACVFGTAAFYMP